MGNIYSACPVWLSIIFTRSAMFHLPANETREAIRNSGHSSRKSPHTLNIHFHTNIPMAFTSTHTHYIHYTLHV